MELFSHGKHPITYKHIPHDTLGETKYRDTPVDQYLEYIHRTKILIKNTILIILSRKNINYIQAHVPENDRGMQNGDIQQGM